MAEVALAPEAEVVTPPEDVANPTPEVTPEAAPEVENQEAESSFIDDMFKGIDAEGTSTADDGKGPTTDGSVPPPANAPLSEEAIRADERRKLTEESNKQRSGAEYLNRLKGLDWVVKEDAPAKLTALAEKYGMQPLDVTELFTQFNRVNGALKPLLEYDLEQQKPQIVNEVGTEMQRTVANFLYEAAKEELGEAAVKALQSSNVKTWPEFGKAMFKEARKGWVTEEAARAEAKKVSEKRDARLNESLAARAARGIVTHSLQDIDGNGHTSVPAAQGGTGAQPKNYAEAEAWHASGKWDNAQMRQYRATHSRD
jgi:hypothetical protein